MKVARLEPTTKIQNTIQDKTGLGSTYHSLYEHPCLCIQWYHHVFALDLLCKEHAYRWDNTCTLNHNQANTPKKSYHDKFAQSIQYRYHNSVNVFVKNSHETNEL